MRVYQLKSETNIKIVLGGDVRDIRDIKKKIKAQYKIDFFDAVISISYDSLSNTSYVDICAKDIKPCEIEL